MNSSVNIPASRDRDSVAAAMEEHFRKMEAEGYGKLAVEREGQLIRAAFGTINVQAENYDIALVRLASAVLSDVRMGHLFLDRIRGTIDLGNS